MKIKTSKNSIQKKIKSIIIIIIIIITINIKIIKKDLKYYEKIFK
jgi:hypothetical protein